VSSDLYQDRDARLNTVVGDNRTYWAMLGRILQDAKDRGVLRQIGIKDHGVLMQDWCEQEHGFRMVYDSDGNITSKPDIVDAQKYMLCVLKYGG
jgi:hypothetical protein